MERGLKICFKSAQIQGLKYKYFCHTKLKKILKNIDFFTSLCYNTRIGTILDAFAYYSCYESIPAYVDVLLMGKVARSEDSEEMLQLVFDTSAYDLGTGMWSSVTKNQYVNTIFSVSKSDIASKTEEIKSGIEAQLEKFNTSLKDMTEYHALQK